MIHDNSNIFQHDLEIKTVDTILDSNAEISRNFKKDDYIAENIENDKNKIFNSVNTLDETYQTESGISKFFPLSYI